MPSVKKNFFYNLVLTLCGYIFPLITYPYVSRILGVQNIGICNFVDSIIDYFVLFSMLGIGTFGVREIARVRKDKERRNIVFSNLVFFNIVSTFIAATILIICTFIIPAFVNYKPFLLIGVAKLLFNVFLIEWFYQGIQDFRYITIRTLIVRILYVVSVFVFIRESADVLLYFFLTAIAVVITAVINCIHARKYIRFSFRSLDVRMFIVPIITFGYYKILISMYTTFNTAFLGFTSGDVEVGYFATATKLYAIFMSVLSAFTTVMVPKVSELLHDGQKERLQWIANQTLSIVMAVSIPVIVLCQFCASDIIHIIAGPGYEGAMIPFRIVIFLLLIIGTEQILIQQFLLASTNNTRQILILSTVGAITGVSVNVLLTPKFGCVGPSIAWGVSELVVLFFGIVFVKRTLGITVQYRRLAIDMLWSIPYILLLYVVYSFHLELWHNVLLSVIVTIVVFSVINLWLHANKQIQELVSSLIRIIVNKNHAN